MNDGRRGERTLPAAPTRFEFAVTCYCAGVKMTRSILGLPPLATGEIPCPWTYLGDDYRLGQGPLLLAETPGGPNKNQHDDPVYQAIQGFLKAKTTRDILTAFEAVNALQKAELQDWPMWKCGLGPAVLEAGEWKLEDVAIMNVVPFRTTDRKRDLKVFTMDTGWSFLVKPALETLRPPHVFALGAEFVGPAACRNGIGESKLWVLRRNIGDKSMNLDARKVLAEAREYIRRRSGPSRC